MTEPLTLTTLLETASALAALQFLISLWLSERLKAQFQLENSRLLEALRWDVRVRQQAEKVAEYMAAARDLSENDSPERYSQVNQLSWELALWLPTDIYRNMGQALTARSPQANELTVLMQVRKHLLGESAGSLSSEEVVVHSPGVGKYRYIAPKNGG